MPIRTIIVEDELHSREFLHNVLKEFCPQVEIVAMASTSDEAIQSIIRLEPDLVFLNVELQGESSLDLLKELPQPSFHIVFISSSDHHLNRVIQFSGLDLLLKPIDIELLKKMIAMICHRKSDPIPIKALDYLIETVQKRNSPDQLFVSDYNGSELIDVKNIISIEATRRDCEILLRGGTSKRTTRSISEMENLLWQMHFFRTHADYIINLQEMAGPVSLESNFVQMSNGTLVPLSPKKRVELQEIQKHLSRSA